MLDSYIVCVALMGILSLIHTAIFSKCWPNTWALVKRTIKRNKILYVLTTAVGWSLAGLLIWLTPWWVGFPVLACFEGYSITKIREMEKGLRLAFGLDDSNDLHQLMRELGIK